MKVIEAFISEDRYPIKSPYTMKPEMVVIHNTANDASAANEISYMGRNSYEVSFHYAVDDTAAYYAIPETRNAWHAGDGAEGKGNRTGISIEICYSKSGGERFDKAEQNAAELVADILTRYGWGIDKVKKHNDFAATSCPHRTLANGWDRFIKMVEKALGSDNKKQPETLYAVQVVFEDQSKAKALSDKLTADGYNPTVAEIYVQRNSESVVPAEPVAPVEPDNNAAAISVGDSVKVKSGAKTYDGGGLASFVFSRVHTVTQVEGDRAVIAYKGTVVAAMHVDDLTKV